MEGILLERGSTSKEFGLTPNSTSKIIGIPSIEGIIILWGLIC
jgi:hypothetical protein